MMLNKKLVSGTVLATVMLGGVSSAAFASNATTAHSNTTITNAFHKQGPKLDTAKLAKELGVSEAKLKTALETVHKETPKPSKPTGTPPKDHPKGQPPKNNGGTPPKDHRKVHHRRAEEPRRKTMQSLKTTSPQS